MLLSIGYRTQSIYKGLRKRKPSTSIYRMEKFNKKREEEKRNGKSIRKKSMKSKEKIC